MRSEAVMVFLPPKFLDQTNIAFARPNLAATATSCLLMRRTNSNSQNQSPEFFSEKRCTEAIHIGPQSQSTAKAWIQIGTGGSFFNCQRANRSICIVSAWQQLASRSSPKRLEYQVVSVLSERMSQFSLNFSPPPSFGSAAACPFAFGR